MATAAVQIQHGKMVGDKNKVTTIEPGEKVDKALFAKEEYQALVDTGAIVDDGDYPTPPGPTASGGGGSGVSAEEAEG